jgi:hypothetical protein
VFVVFTKNLDLCMYSTVSTMYEGMKNDDLTRLNILSLRLFCSICALSVYLYWFGITKYHRFNVEPRNLKKSIGLSFCSLFTITSTCTKGTLQARP